MSKKTPAPKTSRLPISLRIFADTDERMRRSLARQILKTGFSQADQDRMLDLAERNRDGTLSPAEKAELMEYVSAGHGLAILHSLARIALNDTPAKGPVNARRTGQNWLDEEPGSSGPSSRKSSAIHGVSNRSERITTDKPGTLRKPASFVTNNEHPSVKAVAA